VRAVKTLVNRSLVTTPSEFLAFERESIALEAKHRLQLAAIPAAPEDGASVRRLLARFGRSESADRAALAKLSAHWSDAAAKRWLRDGIRASLALKSNALELGSRSCGRYFDPATYSR
jgi:hypothetical protein